MEHFLSWQPHVCTGVISLLPFLHLLKRGDSRLSDESSIHHYLNPRHRQQSLSRVNPKGSIRIVLINVSTFITNVTNDIQLTVLTQDQVRNI